MTTPAKILWKRIPVVSVEDAECRVSSCGRFRIETTWSAATGYSRRWVLKIDGNPRGVFTTRKEAKDAAAMDWATLLTLT